MDTKSFDNAIREYGRSLDNGADGTLVFREEVYDYLKKHGFSDEDAFAGMESVRKGKGLPIITDEMRTAPDSEIIEECKHIRYLCKESAAEEHERNLWASNGV